ncbi:MAG: molybdopterin synthase sulfur carrier subunit, partial [Gammaproteobacteria bacterium]|nr:molybdopterin synthase sulfur carrier subunit [Gammaproteobacteria bacterium]
MKITYFAWLRDEIGIDEEVVTLPAEVTNVGMLLNWLSGRGQQNERAFEFIETVKVAVNQ